MITTDGHHWANGITVRCDGKRWGGRIDFYDDGFVSDNPDAGEVATEGVLRTRYMVEDGDNVTALRAVVDTLIADAARLGIELVGPVGTRPSLWYEGDGEDSDWPPPAGWRQLLAGEAQRIDWDGPTVPTMAWVGVDNHGRITDDSTVTIGEWTGPVPERASNGMRLAPLRLAETLAAQGWRMIDGPDDTSQPGMVGIPVQQIKED